MCTIGEKNESTWDWGSGGSINFHSSRNHGNQSCHHCPDTKFLDLWKPLGQMTWPGLSNWSNMWGWFVRSDPDQARRGGLDFTRSVLRPHPAHRASSRLISIAAATWFLQECFLFHPDSKINYIIYMGACCRHKNMVSSISKESEWF